MRLIVILRNPIDRAYSHWAMEHQRGNDPLPFALALEREEILPRSPALSAPGFLLRRPRFYSIQLRRLWRFFGREQVLVLRQEEMRLSPQTSGEDLAHLRIPPGPAITPLTYNGDYHLHDGIHLP